MDVSFNCLTEALRQINCIAVELTRSTDELAEVNTNTLTTWHTHKTNSFSAVAKMLKHFNNFFLATSSNNTQDPAEFNLLVEVTRFALLVYNSLKRNESYLWSDY